MMTTVKDKFNFFVKTTMDSGKDIEKQKLSTATAIRWLKPVRERGTS